MDDDLGLFVNSRLHIAPGSLILGVSRLFRHSVRFGTSATFNY